MSLSLIKLRFQALVLVAVCCVAASYGSQGSTNVITGTIEKVDSGAKTIAVKTVDGTVETVKVHRQDHCSRPQRCSKGADPRRQRGQPCDRPHGWRGC